MKLRLLLLLAAPVFVLSGCTEDDVVSDSFPEPNELDVALETHSYLLPTDKVWNSTDSQLR